MKKPWVCFAIAEEQYIHNVETVKEVLPYEEPLAVPGSPEGVMGILSVRGELITVLSGRSLLGIANTVATEKWAIITIETERGRFGISVDAVRGIVSVDADTFSAIDAQQSDAQDLIFATVKHNDQLLIAISFTDYCNQIADMENTDLQQLQRNN